MSRNDSQRAVECTLTEEQDAERPEDVRTTLVSRYDGTDELEDGYSIRFDGTDETLVAVARFASNELKCCSFATYRIEISPPFDETHLTITGPDGTKELFGRLVDQLETGTPDRDVTG